MRLTAYGFPASVSMLLATDVSSALSPLAPQILQGSALAVLAGTIWYLLAKTLPAYIAASKDQRDAFLAHLAERDKRQVD